MIETETLIVGGGLSGLALARDLHRSGHDVLLAEARERLGGRIETVEVAGGGYDLGPAWFWPGQPRMEALVKELGLERFDQFATGAFCFEDRHGAVQRGHGPAGMAGSWRLAGGLGRLVDALAEGVPTERVLKGAQAVELRLVHDGVHVVFTDGREARAARVVLALPPRLVAQMTFEPALPGDFVDHLQQIPTWMAGQAKAVALYDRAFWREAGLSGDAMSHRGPLVEVHDACPADEGPAALFGFIGVPPSARLDEAALRSAIAAQLGRLFGADALHPQDVILRDWAQDNFTATLDDHAPLMQHPAYGLPVALRNIWDGSLVLSGSETAPQFGGYLEGALEAAEMAMGLIIEHASEGSRA